ncbi:hypothetical protein [Stenotrophomonas panacihumi]|uniref:hypothetical protein n=1 Tax=Stenotrophomonas panacihumi TaxID=676599 RepID=UPI0011B26654|nr:hypothetical protein [Stenotrophomonas panacihumi]
MVDVNNQDAIGSAHDSAYDYSSFEHTDSFLATFQALAPPFLIQCVVFWISERTSDVEDILAVAALLINNIAIVKTVRSKYAGHCHTPIDVLISGSIYPAD